MFQGQPKKVKKVLLLFFVLTESMISKQVLVYFTVLVLQYCYVKANQNYRHVQTGDCILKMKAMICNDSPPEKFFDKKTILNPRCQFNVPKMNLTFWKINLNKLNPCTLKLH